MCTKLHDEFISTYGDPSANTYENIRDTLSTAILILPTLPAYKGLNLQVRLVQVHPELIPVADQPSPQKNIFDSLENDLKLTKVKITSPSAPFSMTASGRSLSFQISSLFGINLNAFVDPNGILVADSDGDGISDDQELLLTPPTDPRLPRTNGYCLDRIAKEHGCFTINCSPTADADGDGLNDCEEKTMKTNPLNIDTDGDGIPDFFESVRGLDPTVNEGFSSRAGDQWSDFFRFFTGLSPYTPLKKVPSNAAVRLTLKELGFAEAQAGSGVGSSYSGKYLITVSNMPVVRTLATKPFAPMEPATLGPAESQSLNLGPTSHGPGVNQVIIMIRVQARENPNVFYWLAKRYNVDFQNPQVSGLNNIDLSGFQQLGYLNDGGGS